jgi:alkylated DNA repair dioxygenase AlkB
MAMSLFDHQVIPLPLSDNTHQSELTFWPQWLAPKQADELLSQSIESIPWRHDIIRMFGKQVPVPRLQNWFADHTNTSYNYSNICMQAVKFPDWMSDLAEAVSSKTGHPFNRALVNYYRDGSDSVDWHADDTITGEITSLSLPHGSLLLMGSKIQHFYQHRLAKVKHLDQARVNYTFRYMDDFSGIGESS